MKGSHVHVFKDYCARLPDWGRIDRVARFHANRPDGEVVDRDRFGVGEGGAHLLHHGAEFPLKALAPDRGSRPGQPTHRGCPSRRSAQVRLGRVANAFLKRQPLTKQNQLLCRPDRSAASTCDRPSSRPAPPIEGPLGEESSSCWKRSVGTSQVGAQVSHLFMRSALTRLSSRS